MSLLDQVRKLEQQVVDRLRQLEPLTREYEQLRKLADRLGVKYAPAPAETADDAPAAGTSGPAARASAGKRSARALGKPRAKRASARKSAAKAVAKPRAARKSAAKAAATPRAARSAGGRGTTARPGQRQDDVLRLVAEQPGITVREIGERLGVDATGLYRVVKRLSEDRRLRRDGSRLHPVDAATSTPAAQNQATDAAPGTADGATGRPGADAPAEPTP